MILVTVGTQKFQFNRLLKAIDKEIEKGSIKEDVFAQIGMSDYVPQYYNHKAFTTPEEMQELRKKASLIITHGGTNSIIEGLRLNIPVVAVPRLEKYGEHVDNHQCEIVDEMAESGMIVSVKEMEELSDAIQKAKMTRFPSFIGGDGRLVKCIDGILKGERHG